MTAEKPLPMRKRVEVVAFNPAWAARFEDLKNKLWPAVGNIALSIEHVGSTSVPGLAAKPVIDLDIVIAAREVLPDVIARLTPLEYEHRGNLGIEDREAFRAPPGPDTHHLYVCIEGCLAVRNHLAVRDYLRAHPAEAEAYSALKMKLAAQFPEDIDGYTAGKTDFLLEILERLGFSDASLQAIGAVNRK